ncbi:hypothetical protein D2L64_21825 [Micromonospora radicis]|uniref:Uncharacterized protein n=1 Tax=Micromonospora radicis TaxID=1894971 RepID=A0A418MQA3_9ACTN|nr:hypothetical protein D2L64_21825 [Micromonospora radicis]
MVCLPDPGHRFDRARRGRRGGVRGRRGGVRGRRGGVRGRRGGVRGRCGHGRGDVVRLDLQPEQVVGPGAGVVDQPAQEVQYDVERAAARARTLRRLPAQLLGGPMPTLVGQLQGDRLLRHLDQLGGDQLTAVLRLDADSGDLGDVRLRQRSCFDH